jgi:hypothetical protein
MSYKAGVPTSDALRTASLAQIGARKTAGEQVCLIRQGQLADVRQNRRIEVRAQHCLRWRINLT